MGKNALLIDFIKAYWVGGIEGCSEVGSLLGLQGGAEEWWEKILKYW